MFMQRFRNLGLIETNENHFLIIKEKKLTDYLAQIAQRGHACLRACDNLFQTCSILDGNSSPISLSLQT